MTFGLLQIVTGDRAINVASIRSIGHPYTRNEGSGGRQWSYQARTLYLSGPEGDGDRSTAVVTEREFEDLLRQPVQLMPAEPGTSILRPYFHHDTNVLEINPAPVIAWALCVDGVVRPVAPGGVNDGCDDEGQLGNGIFVELPGGKIEGVGNFSDPTGYKDLAAMRADLIADHTPKRPAREPGA